MLKTILQYLITDLKIRYTWVYNIICIYLKTVFGSCNIKKGKVIPLQSWCGPEGG